MCGTTLNSDFVLWSSFHKTLLARTNNLFGSIDSRNKFHVSYQIGIALCVLLAQSMVIYIMINIPMMCER